MQNLRRDANTGEASRDPTHAYEPPIIVAIGRVEDLTRGNKGKGGDALSQKSV